MKNKMSWYIVCTVLMLFILLLSGCNKQIIDLDYSYSKAICNYENDSFTLVIKSWKDYDGEQIQVKTKDKTYLISMNRCYLIK